VKSVTGEKVSETDVGEKIDIQLDLKDSRGTQLSKRAMSLINSDCNLN
jgi:hypothetical protein